jgi:hypothetical protein
MEDLRRHWNGFGMPIAVCLAMLILISMTDGHNLLGQQLKETQTHRKHE